MLPKSVHADRIAENLQVSELPEDLFQEMEDAAASHPPQRVVNPSKSWGLNFDIKHGALLQIYTSFRNVATVHGIVEEMAVRQYSP